MPASRQASAAVDLPTPPLPVTSTAPLASPTAAACNSWRPVRCICQWNSVRIGDALAQYGRSAALRTQYTPSPVAVSIRATDNSDQWNALR